jgi:hypothetical protein
VGHVVSAAGRRTPPEVERFAIQIGISWATAHECARLIVVSDSRPALDSLLQVGPRSGQIFSLDTCRSLRPWFTGDEGRTLDLWHSPAHFEWKAQKLTHDTVSGVKIAAGPRPQTSRDYLAAALNVTAQTDWHTEFQKPGYWGNSFLDLEGSKKKPVLPSTHKGGPWLQEAGRELGVFTRLARSVTGHAPVGAYRLKFKCPCDYNTLPVETVEHIVNHCRLYRRMKHRAGPRSVGGYAAFIRGNHFVFAFENPIMWDPG